MRPSETAVIVALPEAEDVVGRLRAAATIAPRLPIRARVGSVRLIQGSTAAGSWHTVAELPLGSPRRSTDSRDRPADPPGTPGSAAPGC